MQHLIITCIIVPIVIHAADVSSDSTSINEGEQYLALIEEAETIPFSSGTVSQIITTSGGDERTLTMDMWTADDGDLSLMAYTDPARVRGDKILQRDGGDDIWYYMKRRDRIRHFSGSSRRQSVMGSDFSYEDLATGDLTEDYTAVFEGIEEYDGESCIHLSCTPTETGPSYDHIEIWAGKDDYLTRKIEYYDEDGHLKTLYLADFKMIDGRKIALKLEMKNLRDGSRTIMLQKELSLTDEPDPVLFTKQALSRDIDR